MSECNVLNKILICTTFCRNIFYKIKYINHSYRRINLLFSVPWIVLVEAWMEVSPPGPHWSSASKVSSVLVWAAGRTIRPLSSEIRIHGRSSRGKAPGWGTPPTRRTSRGRRIVVAMRGWEVVRRISWISLSLLLKSVLTRADVMVSVVFLAGTVGLTLLVLQLMFMLLLFLLLLLLLLFLGFIKFFSRVVDLTAVTVLAGPPSVHHWRPGSLSWIFFVQSWI